MSYTHPEMPPVIRRTDHGHYQLEGQSGVVVAEFDQVKMTHPAGWWSELVDAMISEHADPLDAIHDLTLLSASKDWTYIDERDPL